MYHPTPQIYMYNVALISLQFDIPGAVSLGRSIWPRSLYNLSSVYLHAAHRYPSVITWHCHSSRGARVDPSRGSSPAKSRLIQSPHADHS